MRVGVMVNSLHFVWAESLVCRHTTASCHLLFTYQDFVVYHAIKMKKESMACNGVLTPLTKVTPQIDTPKS